MLDVGERKRETSSLIRLAVLRRAKGCEKEQSQ